MKKALEIPLTCFIDEPSCMVQAKAAKLFCSTEKERLGFRS